MDACTSWWAILMMLAVVAVIGHCLWLLGALLFGALFGSQAAEPRRRGIVSVIQCIRCSREFRAERGNCPGCDLDPECVVAVQYRQLEVAADQIGRLVRHDFLSADSAAPVQASIDRMKSHLLDSVSAVGPAAPPAFC